STGSLIINKGKLKKYSALPSPPSVSSEAEQIHEMENIEVTDQDFIKITEEKFRSYDLRGKPATRLANFISELKKSKNTKSNTELEYVFVDNSNLLKKQVHLALCRSWMSSINNTERTKNRIQNQGFDVIVLQIKKVDIELGFRIVDTVYLKDPSIALIIAGDIDYIPAINRARDLNWKIEGYPEEIIMECFGSLELFGLWFKNEGPIIYLYFNNKTGKKLDGIQSSGFGK
ncbi:8196_t:CDS:2, partial [Scutellospora calospora]